MSQSLTKLLPLACVLALASCEAQVEGEGSRAPAQEPPSPLHIISSFPEVGSSSRTIRILAPELEAYLERPVEIHYNEGGRGGDIGPRMAAAAPAEQLTLFVGTVGNISLLPNILPSYGVDPMTDFQPVTLLTVTPDVLIANASLGVTTLEELVAYAAAQAEPLTYSHIAPFSIHRMEFLEILSSLEIDARNDETIRGSARAMAAVADGSVDLAMTTAPYVAPLVENGSVVALAVAHEARLPAYPTVPTMTESGIDIPHGSWSGAFVPAATPVAETEQIFRALERALNDDDVVAQLAELGMIAAPSPSPDEFRAYIEEEMARLGAVARAFGIRED